MITLPLHRPNAALHPRHPLDALPVLVAAILETQLPLLVKLVAQIQLDRHAFEDPLALATAGLVDDGGDSAVGCADVLVEPREQSGRSAVASTVDFEVPVLLLLVLRDVDVVDIVLESQFLEGAGDFLAVGGPGCVSMMVLVRDADEVGRIEYGG